MVVVVVHCVALHLHFFCIFHFTTRVTSQRWDGASVVRLAARRIAAIKFKGTLHCGRDLAHELRNCFRDCVKCDVRLHELRQRLINGPHSLSKQVRYFEVTFEIWKTRQEQIISDLGSQGAGCKTILCNLF